jgi:predicted nucleic acid-binding protein
MTATRPSSVVVDTMVISWLLDEHPGPLAERYRALIDGRPILVALQTTMELSYGALHAGWGQLRRRRLERRITEMTVIDTDDELSRICAELRQQCRRSGHALGDKVHDGDRWIAAAAIRLRLPLVSHDNIFITAPRVQHLTAADP